MSNHDVIAKIQKLRALSANNTSIHEAASAAAMADKLIQEHRLAEAELEVIQGANAPHDAIEECDMHTRGRRSAWHENILRTLVTCYNCTWYMSKSIKFEHKFVVIASAQFMTSVRKEVSEGERDLLITRLKQDGYTSVDYYLGDVHQKRGVVYKVVGRESDLKVAEYMFTYLVGELERLGKIHCHGYGVGYALAWYEGAAKGVSNNILKAREENVTQAHSSAMVLLENRGKEAEVWMRQKHINLKESTGLSGSTSGRAHAYAHGHKVGSNVEINPTRSIKG